MKFKIFLIVINILLVAVFTYSQFAMWNILQKSMDLDNFLAFNNVPDHSNSIVTYVFMNIVITVAFIFVSRLIYLIYKQSK